MVTTIRLPDDLKAAADDYARRAGLSVNALVALSLRHYMQAQPISVPALSLVPMPRGGKEKTDPVTAAVKAEREARKRASPAKKRRRK